MNRRLMLYENCTPKQWVALACNSFSTILGACTTSNCTTGGAAVDWLKSSIRRKNFGEPDNNNDGLPDVGGTIDFNKVNVNRYAEGDTMNFNVLSVINTGTITSFAYAGADITIDILSWINAGNATIKIYDVSSANVYNCSLPVVFQNNKICFDYTTCVPTGFVFETGDSIRINFNIRVKAKGTGGQYLSIPFVVFSPWNSNVANPTTLQKFSCLTFSNSYVIFYQSAWVDNVRQNVFNTCGNGMSYMGMGIYTNEFGYTNGNAFAYEYRKATQLDSVIFNIDANYDFANVVKLTYLKSVGTGVTNYILPSNTYTVNGNIIKVNLNSLWNTTSNLTVSTAANAIELQVGIYPKCTAPNFITSFGNMQAWLKSYRTTSVTPPAYGAFATYNGTLLSGGAISAALDATLNPKPALAINAAVASVLTSNTVAKWNIVLNNENNNISPYTFLYIKNTGSLVITQVKDIATNTILTPNANGFYQIGTIIGAATKNFEITASVNSCNIDSICVVTGWGCIAYPSNINNYLCSKNVVLKAQLSTSNIDAEFTATSTGSNGTFLLCQPFSIATTINSTLLGNLANETYKVVLPPHINYTNNSVQIIYPSNALYVSSNYNPTTATAITGDTLIFAINSLTNNTGLSGTGDVLHNQIKIKFNVTASCGYINGKTITAIYNATSICGSTLSTLVKTSSSINIQDATPSSKYAIKLTTPTSVASCQSAQTATITVYNIDTITTTATDTLDIILPLGLTIIPNSFVAINNAPTTVVPVMDSNIYKLPIKVGLQPGDSMKISFQLNADGISCGAATLTTIAKQSLSVNCGISICNFLAPVSAVTNASITAICCANMQITKSVNKAAINIGRNAVYTIIAKNIGTGTATNVVINDVLPTNVTYISSTATRSIYAASNWILSSMQAGASDTLIITTITSVIGTSINTAFVQSISGVPESNTSNDTSSVAININPQPNAGNNKFYQCGGVTTNDTLKGFTVGGVWSAALTNTSGITLDTTINGNATILFNSNPLQGGVWQFIYSLNGDADTMMLTIGINGSTAPAVNMGSNPICKNGEVQFCPNVWGWSNYQWYKNGVAIAAPIGTSSCIVLDSSNVGSYTLAATNGSGCWTNPSSPIIVTFDSTCDGGVSGGSSGGVESKTMGNIIAARLFSNAINSTNETIAFDTKNLYTNSGIIVNGVQDFKLINLVPTSITNSTRAYISTPTDILQFVNAVDILSVDYYKNSVRRAVVFATTTLGGVYSHTKAICDRLKGAEILELKKFNINNYDFIVYKIKQRTSEIEYVLNFSAGTSSNRNTISLQSNWFTNEYIPDEKMYNFQIWAESYSIASDVANKIINKLALTAPVNQFANANNQLPLAYISKGTRKNTDLIVTIQNNTTATNGYFEVKEKANENSSVTTRKIPFTIQPNNQSTITLQVKDYYEHNIYVYLNNTLTDLVYLSDGTWSYDYNKNTTTISKFNITNQSTSNQSASSNDHKLLRNVELTGTTKDYVSIYKTLMGGGLEQDVSNYAGLMFNVNTTGVDKIKITLIKKSILNWAEQYSDLLQLDGNGDYGITFNKFKSTKYKTAINANDIVAINFSFINSSGVNTVIYLKLNDIKFSNTITTSITEKSLSAIDIYPNPAITKFTAAFNSNANQSLILKVIETVTGRIVKTEFINASKGSNKQTVELNNSLMYGYYTVTLEGEGVKYNSSKLMVNKK